MRLGQTIAARHRSQRRWHQTIAALALVLFTFQSYVTQTHIHLLWRGSPAATEMAAGTAHPQKGTPVKLPPADGRTTCQICLDMLLAGHFTSPAAFALIPPPGAPLPAILVFARSAIVAAASHSWYGRAPPRA